MSKLKAYLKALPIYWQLRRRRARRKYSQMLDVINTKKELFTEEIAIDQTVLIFSSVGIFDDHLVVDTLLGLAFKQQGVRVVIVLCDGQLKACHATDRYSYAFANSEAAQTKRQSRLCYNCVGATQQLVRERVLDYAMYSDGLKYFDELDILPQNINVADEVKSGIIRFAASSHGSLLDALPTSVTAAYQQSAEIARRAIEGLIAKYQPTTVIAHHGIYLPQGIVQKVAKRRNLLFYSWHFGYRKSTLIFSRGDTYHRELTMALPQAFEEPLTESQRTKIINYLGSRSTGMQDWIHFNRAPTTVCHADKKYFVLYTSVDWDAALHFPVSVYASQFEFVKHIVEIFRRLQHLNLIIRIHPAEVTGFHPAAMSTEDYLQQQNLPANIELISASDKSSSYELARNCIAAIVYNTKLGIELPPMGIPVIVAGDCWIRGKGFSYDVLSKNDLEYYIQDYEVLTVSPQQREKALEFAFYFYFRRCIDVPELASVTAKFHISVSQDGLQKSFNNKQGLHFIATKIIRGNDVEL